MRFSFVNVGRILRGQKPDGEIPPNRELIANTIYIAWPSILESFLVAMVGVIDTMMVGSLGAYAIAAVGLTTQPKFIGLAFFLSLNAAVSALVARRKGEEEKEKANQVLIQSLAITLIMTVLISILMVTFASPIIEIAGSEPDTHGAAVQYFQIIMGAMAFNTISMVINAAQRGAGNTKISMRTNIISNLINVLFNYLLIGGNLGFPKLGVMGAAIATVLGSMVACGMSIFSILHPDRFLCLRGRLRLRFDGPTLRVIANIGVSTFCEQIFLRIGFLTYAMLVARLGTTVLAAHQIGMNIISISFAFGDGLSVASISLVGQSLGAKRPDLARIYGNVCQKLGLVFAAVLSLIYLTAGRDMFQLFSDDPVILEYGRIIMTLLTLTVFFQIPQVIFSGCLRGAGDVRFTALVSLISVAFIRPGSAWLLTYPLGLGLTGAWLGLLLDQLCRLLLTWVRFRIGKWTKLKI